MTEYLFYKTLSGNEGVQAFEDSKICYQEVKLLQEKGAFWYTYNDREDRLLKRPLDKLKADLEYLGGEAKQSTSPWYGLRRTLQHIIAIKEAQSCV